MCEILRYREAIFDARESEEESSSSLIVFMVIAGNRVLKISLTRIAVYFSAQGATNFIHIPLYVTLQAFFAIFL